MFFYNITTKVENEIVEEWLQWVKHEYIPLIMDTGFYSNFNFLKLVGHDESDGKTFILQFTTTDQNTHESFKSEHGERIANEVRGRWGDGIISFESLLKTVQ